MATFTSHKRQRRLGQISAPKMVLVDQAEPAANICYVLGCQEVADGLNKAGAWSHCGVSDLEPGELHSFFGSASY